MVYLYFFGFFAFFALALRGLFLALFRRGKRLRGLGFVVGGIVAGLVSMGLAGNSLAVLEGWQSATDRQNALRAGITDPAVYAPLREKLEADKATAQAEQAALDASAVAKKKEADRLAKEADLAAKAEAEKQAEADILAEVAEKKRKGFHCLSEWDGAHPDFKRMVKAAMREPDSFEVIETRITPVDEKGRHAIYMEYRARNGFGGMNVSAAVGIVKNDSCSVEVVSLE